MAVVSRKVTFSDFPKATTVSTLDNTYVVGYGETISSDGKYYERRFSFKDLTNFLDVITKSDLSDYVQYDDLDNYVQYSDLSRYATKDYVDDAISKAAINNNEVAILPSGLYLKGAQSGLWYRLRINGIKGGEYLGFDDGVSSLS